MGNVLVVIDMQKKFIEECGAQRVVPLVKDKIKSRKAENYRVVFTLDRAGGSLCDELAEASEGCGIYRKHTYGCKQLITDLFEDKPDRIEFVGVCTDICVITNVLGAKVFLPHSSISVDSKCCASTPRGHSEALRVMKSCKITVT